MERTVARAGKDSQKSKVITVDDYYSERFLRLEIEMKHLREDFNKRFDESNRRFDESRIDINRRFEDSKNEMNRRFDESRIDTNRRFDEIRTDMNKRFDESDRRFDSLTKRIDRFMIWSFGMTVSSTGIMIAAMKFWK